MKGEHALISFLNFETLQIGNHTPGSAIPAQKQYGKVKLYPSKIGENHVTLPHRISQFKQDIFFLYLPGGSWFGGTLTQEGVIFYCFHREIFVTHWT